MEGKIFFIFFLNIKGKIKFYKISNTTADYLYTANTAVFRKISCERNRLIRNILPQIACTEKLVIKMYASIYEENRYLNLLT